MGWDLLWTKENPSFPYIITHSLLSYFHNKMAPTLHVDQSTFKMNALVKSRRTMITTDTKVLFNNSKTF
jgi:hypothetical protein